VFLDAGHLNYIPLHDPVNQVVHAEDGTAVHSVMIGGRMVVENRRLTTIDPASLGTRAQSAIERLRTSNAATRQLSERLSGAVGQFCSAMAAAPYTVEQHVAGPRNAAG
jgi:5-methylthioadenosine/S-adenosylhomocysteine deaminase